MAKKKVESPVSPKGGKQGCLCPDGTYSSECCDGTLQAQGIGSLVDQSTSSVNKVNQERTIQANRG